MIALDLSESGVFRGRLGRVVVDEAPVHQALSGLSDFLLAYPQPLGQPVVGQSAQRGRIKFSRQVFFQ